MAFKTFPTPDDQYTLIITDLFGEKSFSVRYNLGLNMARTLGFQQTILESSLCIPWDLDIKNGITDLPPVPSLCATAAGTLIEIIIKAFLLQQQKVINYNAASSQRLHLSIRTRLLIGHQSHKKEGCLGVRQGNNWPYGLDSMGWGCKQISTT